MMIASLRAIVSPSAAPPPPRGETPAELAARAGVYSAYFSSGEANHTRRGTGRQRLPAYGRQLKAALDRGYRPIKGGGTIIVTSDGAMRATSMLAAWCVQLTTRLTNTTLHS